MSLQGTPTNPFAELVEGLNERMIAFLIYRRRYGFPINRDFVPFYGTQHFCEWLSFNHERHFTLYPERSSNHFG